MVVVYVTPNTPYRDSVPNEDTYNENLKINFLNPKKAQRKNIYLQITHQLEEHTLYKDLSLYPFARQPPKKKQTCSENRQRVFNMKIKSTNPTTHIVNSSPEKKTQTLNSNV